MTFLPSADSKAVHRRPRKHFLTPPKTKDQIQFSSFAMNKSTSSQIQQTKHQGPDSTQFLCHEHSSFAMNKSTFSQMQQTKDQGADSIQFFCHEQINFFPNAADQRPRTRFNSVPLP
jgi:primase-polymerase (primpol)-like protein